MKATNTVLSITFLFWLVACSGRTEVAIIVPDNPGKTELLAAKEIRKYIYLRSNLLSNIVSGRTEKQYNTEIILSVDTMLGDQEFSLKTKKAKNEKSLTITGGSQQALLYGAYEFAEQLGVRFYLHGDVIPDKKAPFLIPDLDIRKKPLFVIRGILPFHDFPEGPDWWNENDYKAIIAQLPKMKMNFIGFHTYPWRRDFNGEGPKAEPLVWIGREEEINADGTVKSAYPALHFHTADSTWGYVPARTSQFLSGASQLFETDNYGPDYMKGLSPWPHSEEENIRIFNLSGKLFSQAFTLAKMLGVKTCVGTETPLVIPEPLKKRYGIQIESEKEVSEFYRGIFSRIQKTYPIDYYWLWTPEGWTWSGVEDKVITAAERDMQIAYKALKEAGSTFSLATCGWVLGPPKDRTQFDRTLPQDMPFSCINRGVGYTPVENGFSAIRNRSKWSIPWMEDDPGLLVTQLWAGRMRKDALDSWKYGCNGLLGIHWRTRIISPNVSALAKAAWDCDKYEQHVTGRDLAVEDFYNDWIKSEFGISDPELATIFISIDSKGTESKEGYKGDSPLNASDWIAGPGAMMTNKDTSKLQERIGRYNFLAKLEAFRSKVSGAGNLERFDYWLNALRFNRAVLETALAQVELNQTIVRMKKEADEQKRAEIAGREAIPERIRLSEKWQDMNKILLSFVTTDGELGTITNLEMHNIRKNGNLTGNDGYLKSVLKSGLPEKANITDKYSGNTRIIVTAAQSILQNGDDFYLRIRVLSKSEQLSGKLYYRLLGTKLYSSANLKLMSTHVFEVSVPAVKISDDFEYYIEVSDGKGKVIYPVTAGVLNNAVVIL
jgi:hypothetical protein